MYVKTARILKGVLFFVASHVLSFLDRVTYTTDAIKKIILESEKGKFSKFAVIQNRKLRREVTTISRMTHKNIVRYYQAWVEGEGVDATIEEGGVIEENSIEKADVVDLLVEAESDNDDAGWWTNSPNERDLPEEMQGLSNDSWEDSKSSSNSTSSWSEEVETPSATLTEMDDGKKVPLSRDLHSASMVNLLEHENDQGLQVSKVASHRRENSYIYMG
jgi:hypothetical protein